MNYKGNAAPPKIAARTTAHGAPQPTAQTRPNLQRDPPSAPPPAKRAKSVENPQDSQDLDLTEYCPPANTPTGDEIEEPVVADPFDYGDNGGINSVPRPVWTGYTPKVGPARHNFKFDPFKESKEHVDSEHWTYSPTMKGWCRYECLMCAEYLAIYEAELCFNFKNGIPETLARDTAVPARWKSRTVPLCTDCLAKAVTRTRTNPQYYNGRGIAVWTLPC